VPLVVTLPAYSRAARSLVVCVMPSMVTSWSSQTPCMGLLFSRYPLRLAWSRRGLLTRLAWACCSRGVTNLARQAPWRRCRRHSHPCRPVARPRFRCRSRGHPPRLGASTDLHHIAPVAISPTTGRSRPLSFVSVMLLARPSPVIVTYVISC